MFHWSLLQLRLRVSFTPKYGLSSPSDSCKINNNSRNWRSDLPLQSLSHCHPDRINSHRFQPRQSWNESRNHVNNEMLLVPRDMGQRECGENRGQDVLTFAAVTDRRGAGKIHEPESFSEDSCFVRGQILVRNPFKISSFKKESSACASVLSTFNIKYGGLSAAHPVSPCSALAPTSGRYHSNTLHLPAALQTHITRFPKYIIPANCQHGGNARQTQLFPQISSIHAYSN